ncbi:MAG: hypothetical protein RIT45_4215 [Pseudomonadota bacterium]|jgi:hypothetical protein
MMHKRIVPAQAALLVSLLALFASGCGASFAPPATMSGFGATARGEGVAAVHGLGTHDGVWQGDVQVPIRTDTDVRVGVVGHQWPGQNKESFTLGQLGLRHRFSPNDARFLPSVGATLAMGLGGHNRAWGDDVRRPLVVAAAVDLGLSYRALPWLQFYGVARTQYGTGLRDDAEGLGVPPTVWLQAVAGTRLNIGPATVGLGLSLAQFWNRDDNDDLLGGTVTVGWTF